MIDPQEAMARLRLLRTRGVSAATYLQLLEATGSGEAALAALPSLAERAGRSNTRRPPIAVDAAHVRGEMEATTRQGARYVFHDEADYPPWLTRADTSIGGMPPILVVRGDLGLAARAPVAIVGARNASSAGQRLARQFARVLAAAGHAVVSGLARGIDAAAHRAALDLGDGVGGGTIGVIASGIDIAYPPEHAELQEQVAREGLLITERPLGAEPHARLFPARNRIIAGLSLGTLVVEAAPGSGSLGTARMAAEYGREVMAIPGSPLDPRSRGCNGLIRDGAILVQEPEEVIELLTGFTGAARFDAGAREGRSSVASPHEGRAERVSQAEAPVASSDARDDLSDALLAHLSTAPMAVDELVRIMGASTSDVQMALIELELAGHLERHAGGRVSLVV